MTEMQDLCHNCFENEKETCLKWQNVRAFMKSRIPNNLFFGTKNDEWIIESYNNYIKDNKKKPLYDVELYKV
jgi:hypothetical protein